MEARFLQTELEVLLGRKCFLDSDDLRDLRLLQQVPQPAACVTRSESPVSNVNSTRNQRERPFLFQSVRESDCLVLLQSKSVLSRPYCLLEMLTAVEVTRTLPSLTQTLPLLPTSRRLEHKTPFLRIHPHS